MVQISHLYMTIGKTIALTIWTFVNKVMFFVVSCIFSNKTTLPIRWPKCWSFSIGPPNEYSGLISFRIDWFDLLAVRGTLKSSL